MFDDEIKKLREQAKQVEKENKQSGEGGFKKTLRKIFNLKSGKRKMTAAALTAALAGGGGTAGVYVYQNTMKYDETFTVQSKETRIEESCDKTMSILDDGRTVTNPETGQKEKVDPSEKIMENECDVKKTYLIHTDKGTYENSKMWLQSKSEDDARRLQEMFKVGTKYNAVLVGSKNVPINDSLIDAKEATTYYYYGSRYNYNWRGGRG